MTTSSGTTHTVLLEPDESTDDRCKMSYFTTHGAGCDGEEGTPRLAPCTGCVWTRTT